MVRQPRCDHGDRNEEGRPIDGFSHPDFHKVRAAFKRQLKRTRGGAAVAVYHRGELVVDLWGGTRDDEHDPWESDTVAMCFSTTKGITATALHLLVDRQEVDVDDPVAHYWPEFAANGKDEVTVRHLLSHSAGLHRLRSVIDRADRMLDWEYMVDALAAAPPAYQPGTAAGYHALTFGWLVGEVVRRVSGQPVDAFIQQEIVAPLELDGCWVGLPHDQRHRLAPLAPFMSLPNVNLGPASGAARWLNRQAGKAVSAVGSPVNPRRIMNALVPRGIEDVFVDDELLGAELPALNGCFTARSLAKIYAMLAGFGTIGRTTLMSPDTVEEARQIQHRHRDLVLVLPMLWRLGYHRIPAGPTAFGHFGFGGSGGWADPDLELSVAMVCNRGTGTPVGDMRLVALGRAAAASINEIENRPPSPVGAAG